MDDIEHRRKRFPLFCRDAEIAHLHGRLVDMEPALTVIEARPQMGKTRLLVEFLHQLSSENAPGKTLTGYAEATNEEQDLLLRAVQSLVENWVSQTSLYTQSKTLWEKYKKNWIPTLGKLTSQLLETVFKNSLGPASGLIADTLKALVEEQSNRPGMSLPKLSYEQCFELLSAIHKLCEQPMILVLDAFEQLPNPSAHQSVLSRILANCNSWPPVHIIVSIRNPVDHHIFDDADKAYQCIQKLKRESGRVDIFTLEPLKEDDDFSDLLNFIRKNVSGVRTLTDEEIKVFLCGYPGVLRRWVDANADTREKVEVTAKYALECRYPEIEPILKKMNKEKHALPTPLFKAALYYALAPEINSTKRWNELATTINGINHQDMIIDLVSEGLLQKPADGIGLYPSFGLTLRYQVARDIVIKEFELDSRAILQQWVQQLKESSSDYLSGVRRYINKLSETLRPDLADQQFEMQTRIRARQTANLVNREFTRLR